MSGRYSTRGGGSVGLLPMQLMEEGFGTEEGLVGGGGWDAPAERHLRLAAISRQRPYLSLLATALDDLACKSNRTVCGCRKSCSGRHQVIQARTH